MNKASLIALSMGVCLSASVWADSSISSNHNGTAVVAPSTSTSANTDNQQNQHEKNDKKSCDKKMNKKECEKNKKTEGTCSAGKCAAGQCSGAPK